MPISALDAWVRCFDRLLCPAHVRLFGRCVKPGIPPDRRWSFPMKTVILTAFAILSLTVAVAPVANAATFHNGSSVRSDLAATRMQQTGSYSQ
jgi:hypothetical protein